MTRSDPDSDDEVLLKLQERSSKSSQGAEGPAERKRGRPRKNRGEASSARRHKKKKKKLLTLANGGSILEDGSFVPDRSSQELEINQLKIAVDSAQRRLDKLECEVGSIQEKYHGVLNPDQVRFISTKVMCQWSPETVLKALRLVSACGPRGYQELKRLHMPYPSLRVLKMIVDEVAVDD